jgi:putative tricarboxylic transport membrane protein
MVIIAAAVALATIGSAFAWTPEKQVEVVVGVAPGGAMDRTARSLETGLREIGAIPATSIVVNKPGGAHAVALSYLNGHEGDPHYIQVVNTPMIVNKLLGRSPIDHESFTPIAVLFEESMVFAVNPISDIKTAADLVSRLKNDPASVSFSVSSGLGTANHFAAMQLAQKIGVDPVKLKTVSFNSASEGVAATLGNHVDCVITTASALAPLVEARQLVAIAIASEKRLGGVFSETPTWREVGVDVVSGAWRAVIAPGKITDEQRVFWQDAVAKVSTTDKWKAEVDREFLTPKLLIGPDAHKFFTAETTRDTAILKDLGVMK